MYGRSRELAQWQDALAHAREGRGTTWLIHGPAGIGKTTLAQELVRQAQAEGVPALWASGDVGSSRDEPGSVIRQWFSRTHARATIPDEAFEGPGGPVRDLVHGELSPDADLHYAVDWVLRELTGRGPVLAVVDDAQWSDPASWEIVRRLTGSFLAEPLILLITVREGEEHPFFDPVVDLAARSHVAVTELAPLGRDAVEAWVADALLDANPNDATALEVSERMCELTGGVPLLLVDVFRYAADNPWQTHAELVAQLKPEALPDSVLASVERRLRGRREAVIAVLAAMTILAEDADITGIHTVLGAQPSVVAEALEEARRADLAASDGMVWRCSHPLVAQAALRGYSEVAGLRLRAAILLRARGRSAERIAAHLVDTPAGADEATALTMADAAELALAGDAPATAVALMERALREGGVSDALRARCLTLLGRAHIAMGNVDAALTPWRASLELLELDERMVRELDLGDALYEAGELSEARESFTRVIDHLESAGSDAIPVTTRRLLVARLAAVSWLIGPTRRMGWDEVDAVMASPVEHDGFGERALLAQMALELTLVGEDAARAGEMAVRAASTYTFADEGALNGPLLSMLTGALNGAECDREALDLMGRALDEARRQGSILSFATMSYCRACVHINRGRLRLARADAESALAAREHGWEIFVEATQVMLVTALVASGDLERAQAVADEVDLSGSRGPLMLAMSHQARGVVAAASGKHALALEHFSTAIELTSEHLTGPTYAFWWTGAIEAASALERFELAHELATKTVARARAFGAPRTLGRILRASAKASPPREAEAMLVEAIELLEAHEGRFDLAVAQTDLAQLLAAEVQDNPSDLRRRARAVDLARRAVRGGQELGAKPTVERALALLEQLDAPTAAASMPVEAVLTPGEERVCRLAAQGYSNREIAEHLFITRKAVEWHLSRSYAKLRITSRAQLRDVLAPEGVSADS